MNWIERMYEIKGKNLYSQSGEGLLLEYIYNSIGQVNKYFIDIGAGDGFHLSNTRHLYNLGFRGRLLDSEFGEKIKVTTDNIIKYCDYRAFILSIDIDGNDYWILDKAFSKVSTVAIVVAEFNAAFSDSRTIKYNPDHVWDGTDYYGFSFEAGKNLFEKHGYKVIFNVANMNMIAVREDLINVSIPTITYQVTKFFEESKDREWIFV